MQSAYFNPVERCSAYRIHDEFCSVTEARQYPEFVSRFCHVRSARSGRFTRLWSAIVHVCNVASSRLLASALSSAGIPKRTLDQSSSERLFMSGSSHRNHC